MNLDCKNIEDQIVAYIDGVLSIEASQEIATHIANCKSCKVIYEETKSLLETFNAVEQETPSDHLRARFYKLLEEEKELQNDGIVPLKPSKNEFPWKRAFQMAASVLLVFSGYFFGTYHTKQATNQEIATLQKQTLELREGMMLAMIENQSPSKRIQAVNFTENFLQPDTKIVEALIGRMQYDGNMNVRLAAAEALSQFPESKMVKDAFIEALSTQKDPEIQIAIIQFLVKIQEKRAIAPMQELLKQEDIPNFVKDQVSSGISQII